jgi:hypothetical protein
MEKVTHLKKIKTLDDLLHAYKYRYLEYYQRFNNENLKNAIDIIKKINELVGMEDCKKVILGFIMSYIFGRKEDNYNFIIDTLTQNKKLIFNMMLLYHKLGITSNEKYFIVNNTNIIHLLKIKDYDELEKQIKKLFEKFSFILIDIEYIDYSDRKIDKILNIINKILIYNEFADKIYILYGPILHTISYFKLDYRLGDNYLFKLNYEFKEEDMYNIYRKKLEKKDIIIPKKLKNYVIHQFKEYEHNFNEDVSEITYLVYLTTCEKLKEMKNNNILTMDDVKNIFGLFEKKEKVDTGMHM